MYSTGFNRAFGEERPDPVPLIPTPLCHPQPRGCPPAMTESREERKIGIKAGLLGGMAPRLTREKKRMGKMKILMPTWTAKSEREKRV